MMRLQDYVDACERLSQLKLTEVQQREIVRVVLHCCGNVSRPLMPLSEISNDSIMSIGEGLQSLLYVGLPTPLLVIAFVQDYLAILLVGFLAGSRGK